jgi:hypothetical protein
MGCKPFGDLDQHLGTRVTIAVEWMIERARQRYDGGSPVHRWRPGNGETLLQQIATKAQCRAKMDLKRCPDAGIKVISG